MEIIILEQVCHVIYLYCHVTQSYCHVMSIILYNHTHIIQDIQDLCTSLVSSSDFPSISDLSLTPVIAMVTRDIQPLIGLIKRLMSH